MLQPLVSLITTVYNREAYLSETIESILSQSYSNFELLIWDDGSTDDSVEIARHYAAQDKRIRIFASDYQGRVPALNSSIAQTTGQYIGLIDSDDLLAVTAIEDTVLVLEANPQIGLVYTDYQTIDEQNQILGIGNRCQIPYSKEALLLSFMVFHFRLMRRSTYEQVGGFDSRFPLAQDYDLCLKISEVTEIAHLPKFLYYYRVHHESVSSQKQIDQILCSKRSIEDAMQRRGLNQQYVLKMRVQSHFSLQHKSETDVLTSVHLPQSSLPQQNAWALAPQALVWLEEFIQSQHIQSVVELGSGHSTISLAKFQQQGIISRSLTLEHDRYWHQDTLKQLEMKQLSNDVQIQHCPLQVQSVQGEPYLWYDFTQIISFATDLILIDGPPHTVGKLARYPALHQLKSFIQPGTWVILDDYHRSSERDTVKRWLQELPTLRLIETLPINTGLAVLQFQL
ncbi:glycosyltransferase [Leptolyngbya sp. GGD]|uniref:glycosyltransferase n=1 Tax=Leptolyngbya sp. GGD TaxID=2997907 RepID=UPI00227A0B0D|nr:glycosyltransferase [Leptolyngbya sp. GGD]MCY6494610.1 glycosyltransferase [Leptolyngbya sp. GGD]